MTRRERRTFTEEFKQQMADGAALSEREAEK